MKALNIFFIVLFIFSAALQYNDPDPYVWMPIYLFGALLCYWAMKKKFIPVLYIIGFIAYGGYAIGLIFHKTGVLDWIKEHHAENIVQTMKATKPWIEETREFLGLILLLVALTLNWFWLRKRVRKENRIVHRSVIHS
jgi:hypothetical protein